MIVNLENVGADYVITSHIMLVFSVQMCALTRQCTVCQRSSRKQTF